MNEKHFHWQTASDRFLCSTFKVVILGNWAEPSAVFCAIISLHHHKIGMLIIYKSANELPLIVLCAAHTCIKGTPMMCFLQPKQSSVITMQCKYLLTGHLLQHALTSHSVVFFNALITASHGSMMVLCLPVPCNVHHLNICFVYTTWR